MHYGDPLNAMACALYSAIIKDLPDVEYIHRSPQRLNEEGEIVRPGVEEIRTRRPHQDRIEVTQFPQVWPSTALGFGGIGGASMTTADTTIITGERDEAAVYFAGRFAYLVKQPNEEFYEALRRQQLAPVSKFKKYERKEKKAASDGQNVAET